MHHASGVTSTNSCDDIGFIQIEVLRAQDNRTPPEKLGYRITVLKGDVPAGFATHPERAQRADDDGRFLYIRWIDGGTDEQESFELWVTLTGVDLAGNESAPSEPIRVQDSGRLGMGRNERN